METADSSNRPQSAPWSVCTYAAAKALIIVLLQVGCYALWIACVLLVFSFVVECTGWLKGKGASVRPKDHQLTSTAKHVQPRSGDIRSSGRSKSRTHKIQGEAEVKHEPELSEIEICHKDCAAVEKSEKADGVPEQHASPQVKSPVHTPESQTYRRRIPGSQVPTTQSQGRPVRRASNNASLDDEIGIGPGNWVLRIRPPHTVLKGTSDEGDVYDGPWEVLRVQEIPKVDHTPRSGKRTSRAVMSAKLRIPKDSLLFKLCEGWVAVDQLVKTPPPLGVTNETQSLVVEGMQLYVVKKVRGRKLDYPKSPKRSRRNTATPGSSTTWLTKTYLVHWAGYPSEDDSWEKSEKVQIGGVPVTYIREWKRREKAWEGSRRIFE